MKVSRRRPLTEDAGRIHTALKRNALQRAALDAQRATLVPQAVAAGLQYREIADALGISSGYAHRLAHTKTEERDD